MCKQRLIFAIFIQMALFAPLWAQSESDFAVALTEDGSGVIIRWYTGKSATVRIPATIQGMPVRVIGMGERESPMHIVIGNSVTSVVIPEGVTTIEDYAFRDSNLKSITLPNTVTHIGKFAFDQTMSLTSINLPENLISIGHSAFRYSGITSVKWPVGIKEIDSSIFEGCFNLKTVTIPEGVTEIGFSRTGITSITLPSTIKTIVGFQNCGSLTTITIPASVTSINFGDMRAAFYNCPKLSLATQAALKKLGYTGSF